MSTATIDTVAVPAGSYRADPVHSSVGFEVKHMISTFRAGFREYKARLESSGDGLRLAGSAEVSSVDVRDENLAAHLQGPEFFDAEHTPRIEFASDRIEIADDGVVTLDGELTIKGITKPIAASGRLEHTGADLGGSDRIGLLLETTIDRHEFGLDWNAPLPRGGFALGDDVKLVATLELVPEEA
jgi:polyisoprenoid-binding protein YceI